MSRVTVQNQVVVIKDQRLSRLTVKKELDTGQHASRTVSAISIIRDNQHVLVNDMEISSHWIASARARAARAMAAVSPSGSPKKSAGQFSISPRMFSLSGDSDDSPSSVAQK
jgi:hypothetical protein